MERGEEPQLWTQWRYLEWIEKYPLDRNTVLDYFAQSPFYDHSCLDELLRQQGQALRDPSKKKDMEGIDYEVDPSSNSLSCMVIRKLRCEGRGKRRLLRLYYVVGEGPERGTVYPMRSLQSVLEFNVATAQYHLEQAFKELAARAVFEPLDAPVEIEAAFQLRGAAPAAAAADAAARPAAAAMEDEPRDFDEAKALAHAPIVNAALQASYAAWAAEDEAELRGEQEQRERAQQGANEARGGAPVAARR